MDNKFFVYIIGFTYNLRFPYDNCYIFYGNNLTVEWNKSSNADNKIGRFIREHNLSFDNNMMVIYFGTLNQCREKFAELRPFLGMGLNDDNDHILFEKKVKTHIWISEVKKKPYEMSRAEYKEWLRNKDNKEKKEKGHNFKGQMNPNAVIWKLTDPNGKEYIVEHGIRNFCAEHNISEFTLKDRLGQVIPEPKLGDPKKCNGFKPKTDELLQRRINTTGWKAERIGEKKPRYRKDWQRDLGIRKYKFLRP